MNKMDATADDGKIPLCVDLDGTLLQSDSLHESLLRVLAESPKRLFMLPGWLMTGKAGFKAKIASHHALDPASLPYNPEVLAWLQEQKSANRNLVLVTAAHTDIAQSVASHLGIFDAVIATTADQNLSGDAKADALVQRYGERGFDYAGNDSPDLRVWKHARRAIVVNASTSLEGRARQVATVDKVFESRRGGLRAWIRALRMYQWVKNALIFLPLLLAHRFSEIALLQAATGAFVAFCLCASSVYILNDLWDLPSDRKHPRKSLRPFASGSLPIMHGLFVAALLLVSSFAIAFFVGPLFVLALAVYYAVTLLYSFWLKRISLVDVMSLSGLYTMRILAGAAAVQVVASFWLLAFSVFLFLSLAIVKRYAEMSMLARQGKNSAAGRAYESVDIPLLLTMGIASGYCAVLVLALYINSDQSENLYRRPQLLWLICPMLLYWVSRVWVLANRGKMHDDPIVFAFKDKISLVVGAMIGISVMLAL
jgi:4-hydroxybenzoate polyprenyltransferase/phosphoserine phosphatase